MNLFVLILVSLFAFMVSFTIFSILFYIILKLLLKKSIPQQGNNNSFSFGTILLSLDDSEEGNYYLIND